MSWPQKGLGYLGFVCVFCLVSKLCLFGGCTKFYLKVVVVGARQPGREGDGSTFSSQMRRQLVSFAKAQCLSSFRTIKPLKA